MVKWKNVQVKLFKNQITDCVFKNQVTMRSQSKTWTQYGALWYSIFCPVAKRLIYYL